MAIALGRPMFINLTESTATPPLDCEVPRDRLKRVPVARSNTDPPTPLTERLLRLQITRRMREIRELESQGGIPQAPEKVKELHQFADCWRKSLPAFFQGSNPDTRWDESHPFVPTHRELLAYLIDSFLMALHRPYIFTREKSQQQVYHSALAILDSQNRFFEAMQTSQTQFLIGLTFPTFDAAVLLAVVLVSNPERYQASFQRPFRSLQDSLQRLTSIGKILNLARTGAEVLETTIRRVREAHLSVSYSFQMQMQMPPTATNPEPPTNSLGVSPSSDIWHFETNPSTMEWTAQMQNPEFEDYDFSNLEVPMPLKELLLDEEAWEPTGGFSGVDNSAYLFPGTQTGGYGMHQGDGKQGLDVGDVGVGDNSLWNFLAGYDGAGDGEML
jgi:hypothetical protein